MQQILITLLVRDRFTKFWCQSVKATNSNSIITWKVSCGANYKIPAHFMRLAPVLEKQDSAPTLSTIVLSVGA